MIVIRQTNPQADFLAEAVGIDENLVNALMQMTHKTGRWCRLGFSEIEQFGAITLADTFIGSVNLLWLNRGKYRVPAKDYIATCFLMKIFIEKIQIQKQFSEKMMKSIQEASIFSRIKNPENLKDYTLKP